MSLEGKSRSYAWGLTVLQIAYLRSLNRSWSPQVVFCVTWQSFL